MHPTHHYHIHLIHKILEQKPEVLIKRPPKWKIQRGIHTNPRVNNKKETKSAYIDYTKSRRLWSQDRQLKWKQELPP